MPDSQHRPLPSPCRGFSSSMQGLPKPPSPICTRSGIRSKRECPSISATKTVLAALGLLAVFGTSASLSARVDASNAEIRNSAGADSMSAGGVVGRGLGNRAIGNARERTGWTEVQISPSVIAVTFASTPTADSTYGRGDQIRVALVFSDSVDVTGTPQLALRIGSATRQADYASGTGTDTLVFEYTVAATDADTDGVSIGTRALTLNGGTIRAAGSTLNAILELGASELADAVSSDATQKVDGSRTTPTVIAVTFTSEPAADSTYGRGEQIRVAVVFSDSVDVTGAPQLALTIGSATRQADYASGTGTDTLVFEYTVAATDADTDGVSIGTRALALNGGTINAVGATLIAVLSLGADPLADVVSDDPAHKVDGSEATTPMVTAVTFTSVPAADSTYRRGEQIRVAVVFNAVVDVTGTPQLALTIGSATRQADYASGTGTSTLVFEYTVATTDADPDGVSIGGSALALNGGTIRAAGSTLNAILALGADGLADAVDDDPAHKVDGSHGDPEPGRPPRFAQESYVFDLAENVAGAVVVGAVSATDPDEGDEVFYRFARGGGGLFAVDATSGEVSYLGEGEDYETDPREHVLIVSAADVGALASTVEVTVRVTNVNEAPVFEQAGWAFDLAENIAGPVVVGAVAASDPDEDDALTYSLASGGDGRFEVDATSGEVRYVGGGEDYERGPREHALSVAVVDAGGLRATADVVVAIANADEAPVFKQAGWAFELTENVAGPVVVGAVAASDPDEDDALTYSLASGGDGRFEVDATSGEVRYVGGGEDYERGPREHALSVAAGGEDGLAARAAVVVTIADVNEGPSFERESYAFELAENVVGPVVVGAVAAADVDEGDILVYSLVSGGGGLFAVDATSGEVSYAGAGENYETSPREHALVLAVTDRGGLGATAGATVAVTDVNEAPEVAARIAVGALEAHGAPVQESLDAYFRDPDGDALVYVAESSDSAVATATVAGGAFVIRPLAIGTALVTVTATDPGGLAAEQTVEVAVEASRSERARVLKAGLAAFGRSIGTEAVDVIGSRLGFESAAGLGRTHLQLGGRAMGCAGGAGGGVGSGADGRVGNGGCGWQTLARTASDLLGVGVQVAHPYAGLGGAPVAGGRLDAATLLFGGPGAASTSTLAGGGAYPGQPEAVSGEHADGLSFNPLSGRDLLERSSFQLSFGRGATSNSATPDNSVGVVRQATDANLGWTVWGHASAGGFEGRPGDGLRFEGGRTRAAHLGADYRFASGLLVGVAGARNRFEAEFESAVNGAGSVDANLTSVHPYVHFSPSEGLGLWALAGAGTGAAAIKEAGGARLDADVAMLMGALGARRQLGSGLALKADAFSVRVRSDDADDLAGVTALAHRVRIAPEVAKTWALGDAASLRTRLELGTRLDAGDAETGLGAEAGGEASFDHAPTGLSVGLRGRALLAHQADGLREWSAGFSLRLQPGGTDPTGLSLSVEPTWGAGNGGTDALWQNGIAAFEPQPTTSGTLHAAGWMPARVAMELGWGVALNNGAAVTPFGRWSQDGGAGQRFNAGARFSLLGESTQSGHALTPAVRNRPRREPRLLVYLYGEHAASPLQSPQRRVGLAGSIQLRQ